MESIGAAVVGRSEPAVFRAHGMYTMLGESHFDLQVNGQKQAAQPMYQAGGEQTRSWHEPGRNPCPALLSSLIMDSLPQRATAWTMS